MAAQNTLPGPDSTGFRTYEEAINLSEQDIVTMAAPNKEPFGGRPGPKGVSNHAPVAAGKPAKSFDASQPGIQGVAPHGTPAKGPKNANKLH